MSLDVIKNTQESLGRFVKKPPLTEKLLSKPPFRYLHDIITAVLKNTGFFEGLFSDAELVSDNVKERDKKIEFLQKVIRVVSMVTDTQLTVKPSKIIAGQEPEKTNELLQKLGEALQKNMSSTNAVQTVLGETKAVEKSPHSDHSSNKLDTEKIKSKPPIDNKAATVNSQRPNRKASRSDDSKSSSVSKISSKTRSSSSKLDNHKVVEKKTKTKKSESIAAPVLHPAPIGTSEESLANTIELNNSEQNENNTSAHIHSINSSQQDEIKINQVERKSSSKKIKQNNGEFIKADEQNEEFKLSDASISDNKYSEDIKFDSEISSVGHDNSKTDLESNMEKVEKLKPTEIINNEIEREKTASTRKINRQSSVEKNNPENNIVRPKTSLRPPSVRPSSSRPGAPRFKDSNIDNIIGIDIISKEKVKIIVEDYDKSAEDDEGSVTVDQSILDNTIENNFSNVQSSEIADSGHLVQQILETQKKLTGDANKVDIEWEWSARREREASHKEIEQLKTSLQALSRIANPISKLVECVQEDVEIMRQEWMEWQQTRKQAYEMLKQQEKITEKAIQPLETKLKHLQDSIADQMEMINALKSNINQNKKKIHRLTNGNAHM